MRTTLDLHRPRPLTPSSLALAALWLLSAGAGAATLLPGLRGSSAAALVWISGFLFILVLIIHLARSAPTAASLPDLAPIVFPRLGFWGVTALIVAGIFLVLVVGLALSPGFSLMLSAALVALAICLAWRRDLTPRLLAFSAGAGLLYALTGDLLGAREHAWAVFELLVLPPMAAAGVLLMRRAGLDRVHLLQGRYLPALKGFLWGCLLSLPAALLNARGGMQTAYDWVTRWWNPLAAISPGIGEEVFARLFLTTLFYALLRPTSNARPRRALGAAILLSALVHSFAHSGFDPLSLVIGALLFGLPMGLLYVKRSLEHAIGYHFFIDLVLFLSALLAN